MTTIEKLFPDLYEILLKLKYPGIAQVNNAKDIEETILSRENRLFLLSWLLAQSPVAKSEEFSINTDDMTLIKWYSNMGICNNPDALMGKVAMQDQIWTLKNLLFFMKNVLSADQFNVAATDQSQIADILKKRMNKNINIIPATCSLTSKLNYTEALEYLKNHRKNLSEQRNTITEVPAGASVINDKSMKENDESIKKNDELTKINNESIKKNCESMEKNDESIKKNDELIKNNDESMKNNDKSNEENNDSESQELDKEAIIEKFVQAFDSVSNWPNSKTVDSTSIMQKSMDNSIDNIHSNMVVLKETLHSKDEISNFVTMEELKKRKMPLDNIIEDIVIRIEEVNRLSHE